MVAQLVWGLVCWLDDQGCKFGSDKSLFSWAQHLLFNAFASTFPG